MKFPPAWAKVVLKPFAVLAVSAGSFFAGFLFNEDPDAQRTSFHDMRVLSPEHLTALVDGGDPAVLELAKQLGTLEAVYAFVRDNIAFEPSHPASAPAEVLRDGVASCLGKAALLASLYRGLGLQDDAVRVVTGQVTYDTGVIEHAWVEIEHEGNCLQQDPSPILGNFAFDQFPGMKYTQSYVRRELFTFNDRGFAIVSQLNRFRTPSPAGPSRP